MSKIDFDIFDENSSTIEALVFFAQGIYNSVKFEEECWPENAKEQVRLMRKIGIKKSRTESRRWLTKQGYFWKCE